MGASHFGVSSLFLQVVLALKHLNDSDICHKDLKPEKIMFTSRSGLNVKVIDFGFYNLKAKQMINRV